VPRNKSPFRLTAEGAMWISPRAEGIHPEGAGKVVRPNSEALGIRHVGEAPYLLKRTATA